MGLVVALAVGVLAGRTLAAAPDEPVAETPPLTYTVVEGMVGRSQSFAGQADWPSRLTVAAPGGGVITSIDVPADGTVDEGDEALTLDLRPLTVAEGAVPAFRVLTPGTEGADVAQLQAFLISQGFGVASDGRLGADTVAAVRAWQRSLEVADTGEVLPTDLVFVPELPTRLRLAPELAVGSVLAPGAPLLQLLDAAPDVRVELASEQVNLVPTQAQVRVTIGDAMWSGVIASSEDDGQGTTVLRLAAADGSAICAAECLEYLPIDVTTNVAVDVIVVPETSGTVVPASALTTTPTGQAKLTRPDGETIDVLIRASANGLSVVTGVDAGTVVLLVPGDR